MAERTTPVLLVTANVGSIFEDPSVMLKIWTEEFLNTVSRLDPKFVALHCQEVGGKNYEESMKHVEYFVKLLMNSEELRLFDKVRVYLDEDYSSAENFTALGNFYFIHQSINDILIWDFKELCFADVEGRKVYAGDIEDIPTKEKSKFPQDFFPECKWSRKGFMRTRWNLNGTMFDLVNIHLFHDASNFIAMESFPSVYSLTRQRALEYTLDRFHNDAYGPAPFFLFGDFNFRTDTQAVIKKLCDGLKEVKVNNGKNCKLEYKDQESQTVLSLGKKEFYHQLHNSVFIQDLWLREYDKEMEGFCGRLFEFPIKFQPSYPFSEDKRVSDEYMPTRVPAWCDRVLMSHTAKPLLEEGVEVEYALIGQNSCMGDHKPVSLKISLVSGAGRLSCCEPSSPTITPPLSLDNSPSVVEPISPTISHPIRTERYLVKRVASASVVEVKVGVVPPRIGGGGPGGGCWRSRSVSVSTPSWRSGSRVRLISKEDLKKSLPRLQSHHSSSEEEWFEEIGGGGEDSTPPATPPPSSPDPPLTPQSDHSLHLLTSSSLLITHHTTSSSPVPPSGSNHHQTREEPNHKCCTLS